MDFVIGLLVLFVGMGLVQVAPGRGSVSIPVGAATDVGGGTPRGGGAGLRSIFFRASERRLRLCGLLLAATSAWWFVGADGVFLGLVEFLLCLSLAASALALAAPLHPRIAPLFSCCAAALAVTLELAR